MAWASVLACFTCIGLALCVELALSSPVALHYNIPEEVTPGSLIANIMQEAGIAQKFSQDVLNDIRFRFLSDPPVDFDLEMTTGSLFTSSRFDREEFCPSLESCVLKLDVALQPVQFFQIIKVNITVEDLNDNVPQFFPQSVSHDLYESASLGTAITLPTAVDMDSPAFGIVNYQLIDPTNTFGLGVTKNMDDSIEVKLILEKPLDREAQHQYELQLVAEDGGGLTGTADIAVRVLDANDNRPVFTNLSYVVSVQESVEVDTIVLQVQAVDPDEGVNGEVRYSFSERTKEKVGHMFSIDTVTGDIQVSGEIDHEEQAVVHLVVIATDMGQGTLPAETTVVVHVQDINDNPPEITVNTLTTSINAAVSEEAPQGTFVAHIIVKDEDSGTNAKFDCHLVHDKLGLMQIDDNEFQIVTKAGLDRETSSYYDITVTCVDHGNPHLDSSKGVRVLVNDYNDNPPHFSAASYRAQVTENGSPGLEIIKMNATDKDIGRNSEIEYSLPYTDSHFFSIDPLNGQVRTAFTFDREKYEQVEFYVIATDKGTPALSSSVLIVLDILDENDEEPVFLRKGYSFGVPENELPYSDVGQVAAADKDVFPNNQFFFTFFPLNSDIDSTETFKLDPQSGSIITIRTLDREEKASYNLVIAVTDQGTPPLSSTTSVTVYVADQNDNTPLVKFPTPFNNTVKIPLNAHRGYVVTRLMAFDKDLGDNAKLNYKLLNDSYSGLFVVDPDYGVVTVTEDVSKVQTRFFSLFVQISDSGSPALSVTTTLNIYVDSAMVLPEVAAKQETSKAGFLESNNFIIVLALGVASVVITIILLLAIILIHRHNRIKKQKKYGRYNCRKEALRIFPNMSRASDERTLTFSGNGSSLVDSSMTKQKKEVSFCLDGTDSQHEGNMSEVVRGANRPESRQSLPSTIDQQVLQYPQAHSSSLSVQVTSTTSLAACQQTALATSTVLGVIHEHDEHRQLEVERLMDMLRRGDEQSVGSIEEGSVTDSGRGPSEEGDLPLSSNTLAELPTFSHACPEKKKVKPDSMQVVPNLSNVSSNSSGYSDSKNNAKAFQTFAPVVGDQKKSDEYRVSSHKDRLASDGSVTSDCTLLDHTTDTPSHTQLPRGEHTAADSVLSDWRRPGHQTDYFYGSYLDYLKKQNSSQNAVRSPAVQANDPSIDGDCTYAGLGYSMADMTDCSKPRIAENTQSIPEEDTASVSTTTSGTYVVDPQALCNEIDALFFKDSSQA